MKTEQPSASSPRKHARPDAQALLSLLADRTSFREFEDRPLPKGTVDAIIADGLQAPSACNHQMWHFIAVSEPERKEALHAIAGANRHFRSASALILLCFHKGWNHNKFAVVQSTAAAAYHMLLSAHLRGLGGVWNAGLGNREKVAALLEIPAQFEIIGILCIGWIKQGTPTVKPPRRPLEAVRSWERFSRPEQALYPLRQAPSYPFWEMQNSKKRFFIYDPARWGWDRIADFRSYAVYAKSPIKGVYLSKRFEPEMHREIGLLDPLPDRGSCLELLPYGGSYTSKLLAHFAGKVELTVADLAQHNIDFVRERIAQDGFEPDSIEGAVIDRGDLPFEKHRFDLVFAPQTLESIPDRGKLLAELRRVLKPKGLAVVTVRNLLSWFGVYFFKNVHGQQVPNFGPYLPLSPSQVRSDLRRAGFEIEASFGFSPTPWKVGTCIPGVLGEFCRLYAARLRPLP